jgi:hypothetical protein
VVLASGNTGELYYIDLNTGQSRSSSTNIKSVDSWVVADSAYFLASNWYVTAYNKLNHTKNWQWENEAMKLYDTLQATPKGLFSAELVSNEDYVFYCSSVLGSSGTALNALYILDKKTGKLLQKINMGDARIPELGLHFVLVIKGKPYYSCFSGNIKAS